MQPMLHTFLSVRMARLSVPMARFAGLVLLVLLVFASGEHHAQGILPAGLERTQDPSAWSLDRVGQKEAGLTDSVLPYAQFQAWVAERHPIARQGALLEARAQARLQQARGGFDPKLAAGWSVKDYSESDYWDIRGAELKIPTWAGVELKADYAFAEGEYVNAERTVPVDGQFGFGLSVNLLEGLITDRRRTDLRMAQAFGAQASAQREALLVDLFLDAAQAYWDWSFAQARTLLADRFRLLAEQQLEIAIAQFEGGNRAAIDTLEARIRVDKRYAEWIEAQVAEANARWMVSAFLWTEDGFPVALEEDLLAEQPEVRQPEVPSLATVLEREAGLAQNHPILRAATAKWAQQDFERRFKAQQILPRLQGSYQWLTPASPFGENLQDRLTADYKFGLELELPLFFRKELGAAREARWKLEQLQWEQAQKTVALEVKLRQAYNALEGGQRLLDRYRRVAEDSRTLYRAEQTRFAIGESTPFLVNSRENSFLDAQLKYLSTQAKQHVLEAKWFWATGQTGP